MAENEFVTPGKGKELSEKNLEYLRDGELYATYKELGIEVSNGGVGEVPVSNGVPRIFLVKDGKVSTLAENNMKLGSEAYYNAMLNGQVFAYPPGEKNPVQMQLRSVDAQYFRQAYGRGNVGHTPTHLPACDAGAVHMHLLRQLLLGKPFLQRYCS